MYIIECYCDSGYEEIIRFSTLKECKKWINNDINKAKQNGINVGVDDYLIKQEGNDYNFNDMMTEDDYNDKLSDIYDNNEDFILLKEKLDKEFNQKNYIKEYQRENYRQFKVSLRKEVKEKLDAILAKNKMTKAEFLKNAIKEYTKDTNK